MLIEMQIWIVNFFSNENKMLIIIHKDSVLVFSEGFNLEKGLKLLFFFSKLCKYARILERIWFLYNVLCGKETRGAWYNDRYAMPVCPV